MGRGGKYTSSGNQMQPLAADKFVLFSHSFSYYVYASLAEHICTASLSGSRNPEDGTSSPRMEVVDSCGCRELNWCPVAGYLIPL